MKLTKAQYNVLATIMQSNPVAPFSASDLAGNPRTLAALEAKGVLRKSSAKYVGRNEQLYTLNTEAAKKAYRSF